ncbi:MAG: TIGR00282 family metallophosphoesterase [Clostridia bacterium]|nr:TIGR00282 family metallophosphoesterase [Clostridia bacterium]
MRVLFVGDVCGSVGCRYAARVLPRLRAEEKIDFTVINGENSADGNGILPHSADMLFSCGADVISGGNHTLRRKEIHTALEDNPFLLRPDNLPAEVGKGYALVDCGPVQVAVINLSGQFFMDRDKPANPFLAADALVEKAKQDGARIILVDFHAEATSEKRALGYYLDGKISALVGTHTHVATADAQILPEGTGYITDLGMTGPIHSVLGVKKDIIIDRLRNNGQQKFVLEEGPCSLSGCIFDIDHKTGKTTAVKPVFCSEDRL